MRRSIVAILTLVLLLWGAVLLVCQPVQTVSAQSIAGSADSIDDHSGPDVSSPAQDVGPAGVVIAGPTMGAVQVDHTFTATVSPVSTTLPVTYSWRASGQEPVMRSGGLSDTVAFSWDTAAAQAVTVTVANAIDTVTDTHAISTYVPVQAVFYAAPLTGKLPLTVVFTDTSTGTVTSWLWSFGDTMTSSLPSPTHTYELTGTFTVTLTVSGSYGSDMEVKTDYVTVEQMDRYVYLPIVLRSYTPLWADFTASPTSGPAPLTVVFTNTSLGIYTHSLWDFGDGITSTQTSPTHTYTETGTYTVTLTVSNLSGTATLLADTSTLVRPNYVTVSEEGTPMPPSDLQATVISSSKIQLDWQDNSNDETGFTLYDGTGYTDIPANTTVYTDTGLAPGSYHCYLVRAYNEHGDSDWSNWACATTEESGCSDAITNGGFEDDSGWVIPETPYLATYTTAITRTGNRSMRAGIVESADNVWSYSSFRQTVTIPADVASATLRFWLYRVSGEPPYTPTLAALPLDVAIEEANLMSDLQYVVILDENDQERTRLVSQRIDDQRWTSHEFDLGAFAGQTIKVHFGVFNDGVDGVTAMYVDDVSLDLCDSSADRWLRWKRSRRAPHTPIGLEAGY
jgi:PKD repeat protein